MGGTASRQKQEGGSLAANYSMVNYQDMVKLDLLQHKQTVLVIQLLSYLTMKLRLQFSFAVNDNLSISYTEEDRKVQKAKQLL